MALIHVQHSRPGFSHYSSCGRRSNYRVSLWTIAQPDFIKRYTEKAGRGFCSKCAKVLIEGGFLVAAENTITDATQELITKLKTAMQEVHDQYIVATRKFAKDSFKMMQKWNKKTYEQWLNDCNIPYTMDIHPPHSINIRGLDSERYHRMRNRRAKYTEIVEGGFKKYEASEIEHAERHYESCIWKLTDRIKALSLNTKKMTIKTGDVRDNGIETVITDGVNTIRAWSIIAQGPIKRPHYRYLVK